MICCNQSGFSEVTGSNPVLTTIVSVMAAHEKLRYNARLVNKRHTERKESYGRIRCESPQLNLLRLCKVKSTQSGLVQGRFESDGRSWMSGSSLQRGSIPLLTTQKSNTTTWQPQKYGEKHLGYTQQCTVNIPKTVKSVGRKALGRAMVDSWKDSNIVRWRNGYQIAVADTT